MTDKFYNEKAKQCKQIMQARRESPKGSLKDIIILIKAMEVSDYSEVYKTKLYTKYSSEYCEYLEIISRVVFGR